VLTSQYNYSYSIIKKIYGNSENFYISKCFEQFILRIISIRIGEFRLNLRQLEAFYLVVKKKSFTRAAEGVRGQ
jgi:hypothetical protein